MWKTNRIDKPIIGHLYSMTTREKATQISQYQPGTEIIDGDALQTRTVTVTNVEDRGDFYYVGYEPESIRFGRWGYTRIYKLGRPNYGTVIFAELLQYDGAGDTEELVAQQQRADNV